LILKRYKINMGKLRKIWLWFYIDTWIGNLIWIIFIFLPKTLTEFIANEEPTKDIMLYGLVCLVMGVVIGFII